jgi:hypothetical protein
VRAGRDLVGCSEPKSRSHSIAENLETGAKLHNKGSVRHTHSRPGGVDGVPAIQGKWDLAPALQAIQREREREVIKSQQLQFRELRASVGLGINPG